VVLTDAIFYNVWLFVDPPSLGGCMNFFKPKYSNELKEGNKIIRIMFFGSNVCVLS
jgi:hypothetical protein